MNNGIKLESFFKGHFNKMLCVKLFFQKRQVLFQYLCQYTDTWYTLYKSVQHLQNSSSSHVDLFTYLE